MRLQQSRREQPRPGRVVPGIVTCISHHPMPGLQLRTRIDHLALLSSHAGMLQNHTLAGISTWY